MNNHVDRDPLAEALRASLARHATDAPKADALAERIIAATDRPPVHAPRRSRQSWRTWALPLVAAAAVGAVVTAVVSVEHYRPEAAKSPAAGSPTGSSSSPSLAPTGRPSTAALGVPLTDSASTAAAQSTGLTNFRAVDSTFVGHQDGWLLGTADCLNGDPGPCPAMLRTTDGGGTWQAAPQPPGNAALLTCAAPCITHLRFASSSTAYAYSATGLEMTTDGGRHWLRQTGGAEALETLDGNVIRLVSDRAGCTEPCGMSIQTASVGSSSWRTVTRLDTKVGTGLARLVRVGRSAAVLVSNGPAGSMFGYPGTRSSIYTSPDDGATWTNVGDPCRTRTEPVGGRLLNAVSVSAGSDGSLGVLCLDDAETSPRAVPVVAPSFGAPFTAWPDLPLGSPFDMSLSLATRDTMLVVDGTDGLYRSTDGGASWRRVGIPAAKMMDSDGAPGFADTRTAHWVTGGTRLWTTHDQGRTWSEVDVG